VKRFLFILILTVFLFWGCGTGTSPTTPVPNQTLRIVSPPEDGIRNVVGEGVILQVTIECSLQDEINVVDTNGEILYQGTIRPPEDVIELKNFGTKGEKEIKIRSLESPVSTDLRIINDDKKLLDLAKKFALEYCCLNGKVVRLRQTTVYIEKSKPPVLSEDVVGKAVSFWEKMSPIKFILMNSDDEIPLGSCTISFLNQTDEGNPSAIARAVRLYATDYEVNGGFIRLYSPFETLNYIEKINVIMHEIGHIIFSEKHTEYGDVMDISVPIEEQNKWWPFQQKGLQLLYSVGPGEPIP
jgi:hypothetical protein